MMKGRRSHERHPPRRRQLLGRGSSALKEEPRWACVSQRRLAVVACIRDSAAPRRRGLCSRLDAASPSCPTPPLLTPWRLVVAARARDSTLPRRCCPTAPLVTPQRLAVAARARDSMPSRAPASTFLPWPRLGLIDSMGIEMIWVRSRLFIGG
jgi:hypothetical protein